MARNNGESLRFKGKVTSVHPTPYGKVITLKSSAGPVQFSDSQWYDIGAIIDLYGEVYEITLDGTHKVRPYVISVVS